MAENQPTRGSFVWPLIVLAIIGGGLAYWRHSTSQIKVIPPTTPAITNDSGTVTTTPAPVATPKPSDTQPEDVANDPVTKQLQSISANADNATLRAELNDTNLNDITPELKALQAEVSGQ